jgi:hypothetical protein
MADTIETGPPMEVPVVLDGYDGLVLAQVGYRFGNPYRTFKYTQEYYTSELAAQVTELVGPIVEQMRACGLNWYDVEHSQNDNCITYTTQVTWRGEPLDEQTSEWPLLTGKEASQVETQLSTVYNYLMDVVECGSAFLLTTFSLRNYIHCSPNQKDRREIKIFNCNPEFVLPYTPEDCADRAALEVLAATRLLYSIATITDFDDPNNNWNLWLRRYGDMINLSASLAKKRVNELLLTSVIESIKRDHKGFDWQMAGELLQ